MAETQINAGHTSRNEGKAEETKLRKGIIPSIQFFFGLPRAHFRFGIHFNAISGNFPSAIL
jgi:hypothetical protein